MVRTAQSMMVSVRSPRKSNLTRPAASTSSLSNWVTTVAPLASEYSGVKSVSTEGAITTPPACLPSVAGQPFQRAGQVHQISDVFLLRVGVCGVPASSASALSRVMPSSKGTSLAMRSTKP